MCTTLVYSHVMYLFAELNPELRTDTSAAFTILQDTEGSSKIRTNIDISADVCAKSRECVFVLFVHVRTLYWICGVFRLCQWRRLLLLCRRPYDGMQYSILSKMRLSQEWWKYVPSLVMCWDLHCFAGCVDNDRCCEYDSLTSTHMGCINLCL